MGTMEYGVEGKANEWLKPEAKVLKAPYQVSSNN